MRRKRFSPEQIITMLREAEVLLSQGWRVYHKRVERIWRQDVLDQLYELFLTRGTPDYIRSDMTETRPL